MTQATAVDARPNWRDLPKGKYLYPHLDEAGDEVAFSLWFRTVPIVYKTGRTVGKHSIVHRVRRAPRSRNLPRNTFRYLWEPAEEDRMLREFLAAPDLYRALYGQHENHCGICGRTLTDPASRERGIGPECAAELGIIGNRFAPAVTVTPEDVARLRQVVAAAHPDRGGTNEAFREAYAEYMAAKARLREVEAVPREARNT